RKKLTNAELQRELQSILIPALQELRAANGLTLTGELAEMEKRNFSMHDFWEAMRSIRGEPNVKDEKPLTIEEYGEMQRLLYKVRLDTWRALADEMKNNHPFAVRALMDDRELDLLFAALDDDVNEANPLYRWFESSRKGQRFDE